MKGRVLTGAWTLLRQPLQLLALGVRPAVLGERGADGRLGAVPR